MMIKSFRKLAQKNIYLRKLFGYFLASSGLVDFYFKNYKLSPSWQKRLKDIISSKDNKLIPKVVNAGIIKNGKQTMHNGLKIYLGSYYGPEFALIFLKSKGVHEPQEERVFGEVLKKIKPGSTMIELGAFWSFYSMWFNKEVENAINYMVEPDSFNLGQGKRNFKLNKLKGKFIQAFSGKLSSFTGAIPVLSLDDIIKSNYIDFVDILHSDIQGFEYDMLQGAINSFNEKKIGYVFISTHSNEVHNNCLSFLNGFNFIVLANADIDHTFSEDGLIVARAPYYEGIEPILIDLKD